MRASAAADYLTPFLPPGWQPDDEPLTSQQVAASREACLQVQRDRSMLPAILFIGLFATAPRPGCCPQHVRSEGAVRPPLHVQAALDLPSDVLHRGDARVAAAVQSLQERLEARAAILKARHAESEADVAKREVRRTAGQVWAALTSVLAVPSFANAPRRASPKPQRWPGSSSFLPVTAGAWHGFVQGQMLKFRRILQNPGAFRVWGVYVLGFSTAAQAALARERAQGSGGEAAAATLEVEIEEAQFRVRVTEQRLHIADAHARAAVHTLEVRAVPMGCAVGAGFLLGRMRARRCAQSGV